MSNVNSLLHYSFISLKNSNIGHSRAYTRLKTDSLEWKGITLQNFEVDTFTPDEIRRVVHQTLSKFPGFTKYFFDLEWIHEVSNISYVDQVFSEVSTLWISTGSLSRIAYGQKSDEESRVLRELSCTNALQTLFLWDEVAVSTLENPKGILKFLIDKQDIDLNFGKNVCCGFPFSTKPVIGHFGQLYPYRGLARLLELSQSHEFSILIAGQLNWEILNQKQTRVLSDLVKDGRLLLFPNWLENEAFFDHLYEHIDAFFLDARNYPQPSGFANRAIRLGIPLLMPRSESYYWKTNRFNIEIFDENEIVNLKSRNQAGSDRESIQNIQKEETELFREMFLKGISA